jgi:hypothetical protein
MAQARITQVRLRFARTPTGNLTLRHGQREQPNTFLPGKSSISYMRIEKLPSKKFSFQMDVILKVSIND